MRNWMVLAFVPILLSSCVLDHKEEISTPSNDPIVIEKTTRYALSYQSAANPMAFYNHYITLYPDSRIRFTYQSALPETEEGSLTKHFEIKRIFLDYAEDRIVIKDAEVGETAGPYVDLNATFVITETTITYWGQGKSIKLV